MRKRNSIQIRTMHWKKYFLRVIPTQKHYSDIVSDIHLEVYLAYPFRHSIWHPFGHTLWHSTWHSVSDVFACAANPLYLCISPRPWAVQTNVFWWAWYRSPVTLFAIAIAVPCVRLLCLLGNISMRTMAFLVCLVAIPVSPLSIRIIGTKPFWGPDTNQTFEDSGCSCWIQVPTSFSVPKEYHTCCFFLDIQDIPVNVSGTITDTESGKCFSTIHYIFDFTFGLFCVKTYGGHHIIWDPRGHLLEQRFHCFALYICFWTTWFLKPLETTCCWVPWQSLWCSNQALLVRSLWHSTHVKYQLDGGPNNYILQSYCMPWNL